MMSINPGIWAAIISVIGGIIIAIIGVIKEVKGIWTWAILIFAGIVIGGVIGIVIYPCVFEEPVVPPPEPRTLHTPFDVSTYFYPSGWMGDGEYGGSYIELNTAFREEHRPDGICIRISYQPGPMGWAGIYWQYPDSNWGDQPGSRIVGATRITFWARGETGGEIVGFKAGGIGRPRKPNRDSFEVSMGHITLSEDWGMYELNLTRQDLSHAIGAFAWVATRDANPQGLIFYIDDIQYE